VAFTIQQAMFTGVVTAAYRVVFSFLFAVLYFTKPMQIYNCFFVLFSLFIV